MSELELYYDGNWAAGVSPGSYETQEQEVVALATRALSRCPRAARRLMEEREVTFDVHQDGTEIGTVTLNASCNLSYEGT